MTELRKAAEMALEALDGGAFGGYRDMVVETLRQALAQPVDAVNISQERVDETVKGEHEPIGYINGMHGGYMVFTPINPSAVYLNGTALYTTPPTREYVTEVVAMHENGTRTIKQTLIQKRKWVGLTDEEIYDYADKFLYQHGSNYGIRSFGKALEAKLKEKNV